MRQSSSLAVYVLDRRINNDARNRLAQRCYSRSSAVCRVGASRIVRGECAHDDATNTIGGSDECRLLLRRHRRAPESYVNDVVRLYRGFYRYAFCADSRDQLLRHSTLAENPHWGGDEAVRRRSRTLRSDCPTCCRIGLLERVESDLEVRCLPARSEHRLTRSPASVSD